MNHTNDDWRSKLSPEQYSVMREKGTEYPGSGKYILPPTEDGVYTCAACNSELFSSKDQYESTTPGLIGWPSFSELAHNNAVELKDDTSMGMHRTEVTCATCHSHLGHLFPDDSSPNGQHYCINSVCLNFAPDTKK